MVWGITYGLRQRGTALRGFTIFVIIWSLFWGLTFIGYSIVEISKGEESTGRSIFSCTLGSVLFISPMYLIQDHWVGKHKKKSIPPDSYKQKVWIPITVKNRVDTKACLSCGQMVDIRYSLCPFCKKPTAPDRGRGARPGQGAFQKKMEKPNRTMIIQNIGQFITGDKISIRDSVIQRSSVGGGFPPTREIKPEKKGKVLDRYKKILHHVYEDGYVDASEYELLKMLREREDITAEEHSLMEWEVLNEREGMGK